MEMISSKEIATLIEKKQLVIFSGAAVSFYEPSKLLGFDMLQNEVLYSLYTALDLSIKSIYDPIYQEINEKNVHSNLGTKILNLAPEYVFYTINENIPINGETSYTIFTPLKDFMDAPPNKYHHFLAKLLIDQKIPAIFTTNFDTLIESAISAKEAHSDKNYIIHKKWLPQHFTTPSNKDSYLFKLHGCINDTKSIIIALDEVGKRSAEQKYDCFRYYLENYFVFFMGYRGADIDIYSHLATTKCKGIIWNALSQNEELPKIRRLINSVGGRIIYGSIFDILEEIRSYLGIPTYCPKYNSNLTKKNYKQILSKWSRQIPIISKYAILADIWQYVGEWELAVQYQRICLRLAILNKDDELEVAILFNLANIFYSQGKYKNAEDICDLIKNIINRLSPNNRLLGLINYAHFMGLLRQRININESLSWYNRGIKYIEQLSKNDPEITYKKGQFYMQIANCHYIKKEYNSAAKIYGNAIKIFDAKGYIQARGQILASLGNICYDKMHYNEAIYLYKEAEYLFEELNSIYDLPRLYYSLALVYFRKLNYNEARSNVAKSIKYYKLLSDSIGLNKAITLFKEIDGLYLR